MARQVPRQASQGKGQGRKPLPGLVGYVSTGEEAWRPSLNRNGAKVHCFKVKLRPRMRRLKTIAQLQKELDEGKVRVYVNEVQIAGSPKKPKNIQITVLP